MRLMTKELEKRFAEVGSQDNVKDPVIIAKFFTRGGGGTWYATDYNPEKQLLFGYISICGDWDAVWDCFSVAELESYKNPWGVEVERDLYWTETKASSVIR